MELVDSTIRDVLGELSKIYGQRLKDEIFDPLTNDVRAENQILLNGRHSRYLPKGLDTALKDGDVLALFPRVAGG